MGGGHRTIESKKYSFVGVRRGGVSIHGGGGPRGASAFVMRRRIGRAGWESGCGSFGGRARTPAWCQANRLCDERSVEGCGHAMAQVKFFKKRRRETQTAKKKGLACVRL